MSIEPGILAEVIESLDGAAVGSIVQVISLQGEHSLFGPIWKCRSKDTLVTEFGGVGNEADFAQKWLRPIRPSELDKTTETRKELDKVV